MLNFSGLLLNKKSGSFFTWLHMCSFKQFWMSKAFRTAGALSDSRWQLSLQLFTEYVEQSLRSDIVVPCFNKLAEVVYR